MRWATRDADASWTFDVQYRIGDGSWQPWRRATSARSGVFDGDVGTTYVFRARATNPAADGGTTSWSPRKTVFT